ncbi:nuclear transport factor 2 family protein [Mycolicibacterium sp. P1-5]|uniref:nuclear transport factor 2 family protein n=1 Tax=Mycolicibacterium sp. P1-5 TaxID=2024617 RepID=UPI0011EE5665|nr:nuclear transport factor 2 family protein [Mycolicibacterium sp. P1-5]KAA0112170.1 nuclear transport factor 2 family protein [Mycolicibacterium sp. P1-5]
MTDFDQLTMLAAQYCHRFDDAEFDDLLALFTAEATIELGGQASTGHAALREFFTAVKASVGIGRHLCVNPEFTVDGDTATGLLDFLLTKPDGTPPMVGRYHDAYQKSDGRWQFAVRRIVPAG